MNKSAPESLGLRESEMRFQQLVRLLPVPVALYDAQGNILLVNDRLTATYGYTREDVPHLSAFWPLAFPNPVSRARAQERWAAALAESERLGNPDIAPDEYLITCKDGTVRVTEAFGTRLDTLLLVVLNDVTSRRQAEAELDDYRTHLEKLVDERTREVRIRQERLVVALEATNTGLWEWDPTTREMYFSPTYFTMLGWEPDEFPANQETWMNMVHPDDLPETYAFFHDIANTPNDIAFSHEYRLRTKQGAWRWLLVRGKIVRRDDQNRVCRVAGVYIDINKRKDEERRLQMAMQALDTTRECVYWLDQDGRILYVNPATELELGYTAEELGQMSIPDIDPNTPAELWGADGELTRRLNSEGLRKFITQHRHRDGHLITVEVDSDAFHYEGQTCFIAIARDISARLAAEAALRKSEEKFAAIFSLMPEPLTLARLRDGLVLDVSRSAAQYWGHTREELVGRTALPEDIGFWTDPEQRRLWADKLRRDGEVPGFETIVRRKDGAFATVLMFSKVLEIDGEQCVISNIHDISERRATEEALRKSEEKFAAIFSLTPEPMALTRLEDGVVLDVSRSYAEFFGYGREELVGRTTLPGDLGLWVDAAHRLQWKEMIKRDGEVVGFETPLRRKDGSIVTALISGKSVDIDGAQCIIVDIHDITELKQHEHHLERIAHHDSLTGLPNRLLLGDRLRQAIAQNQRTETSVAVCYLDLDGFKRVNDLFGHQAGDQLLVEVANRLTACLRGGDTVARLGGDEFVILLSSLIDEAECRQVLDRVLRTVSAPYTVGDGKRNLVSASIGVTLFPNDQVDPDTLLRHADHAMYAAKEAGKNRYNIFETKI